MSSTSLVGPLPRGYEMLWERMHELSPGDPGRSRFTALLTRGLVGRIDQEAMRDALTDVTRRHEMLRMRFRTIDLAPRVEIVEHVTPELHVTDLERDPPSSRKASIEHLLYQESVRAFDLRQAPTWYARLLRLSPEYSILCLSFPDFQFDAWSDRILVRDLIACYGARLGLAEEPAPVPYGYRDLLRLHERQYGQCGQRAREHARRLHSLPRPLSVETRPTVASDLLIDPVSIDFSVPPDVAESLAELAARLRTTTFVVMMAAYSLMIAGTTGRSDVVVSTVTLGRRTTAERAIVGQFGQDVFVPVEIAWKEPLDGFIRLVHRALVDASLARTSYRNLVPLLGHGDRPRPWSDLNLFDSYFQSIVPGSAETGPEWLRVQEDPGVRPCPQPGVDSYPRLAEVGPEAIPAWQRQGQPWILVDDHRRAGALHFNRSFFDETQMSERVASYLEVLGSIAEDTSRPAWKATG